LWRRGALPAGGILAARQAQRLQSSAAAQQHAVEMHGVQRGPARDGIADEIDALGAAPFGNDRHAAAFLAGRDRAAQFQAELGIGRVLLLDRRRGASALGWPNSRASTMRSTLTELPGARRGGASAGCTGGSDTARPPREPASRPPGRAASR
jgi:hypothetical protein